MDDIDYDDEVDGRGRGRGDIEREDPRSSFCRKLAERTLARYGVNEPPVPVDRLAAKMNVRVRVVDLRRGVDARLRKRDGQVVIELAAGQARVRHRFSLAHELGHLVLGHDHGSSEFAEIQANAFAAALLMPPTWLRRDVAAGATADKLATRYGVSREALFIALKDARLLNKLR